MTKPSLLVEEQACVEIWGSLYVGHRFNEPRGLIIDVHHDWRHPNVCITLHHPSVEHPEITLTLAEARAMAEWLCHRIKAEPTHIQPSEVFDDALDPKAP